MARATMSGRHSRAGGNRLDGTLISDAAFMAAGIPAQAGIQRCQTQRQYKCRSVAVIPAQAGIQSTVFILSLLGVVIPAQAGIQRFGTTPKMDTRQKQLGYDKSINILNRN